MFLDNILHFTDPILLEYDKAVVLPVFILTCLEPFQGSQYLFKAKKTAFRSKKLTWLCSFTSTILLLGNIHQWLPKLIHLDHYIFQSQFMEHECTYNSWEYAEATNVPANISCFPRRLQRNTRLPRPLDDVFKTSSRRICNTSSSKRLENVFQDVCKTSSVFLHQDECLLG